MNEASLTGDANPQDIRREAFGRYIRDVIPQDILREIFGYLMDPIVFDQRRKLLNIGERGKAAGGLSKHWRRTLVDMPEMWGGLEVHLDPVQHLTGGFPRRMTENLRVFLDRSEGVRLRITFTSKPSLFFPMTKVPDPLAALLEHSNRWESVVLPFGNARVYDLANRCEYVLTSDRLPYRYLLPRLHSMPKLRSVVIWNLPNGSPKMETVLRHLLRGPDPTKHGISKLCLHSLTVRAAADYGERPAELKRDQLNGFVTARTCESLTKLEASLSPSVALRLFSLFPNLERAGVWIAPTDTFPVSPPGRVVCHKIRELHVALPSDKWHAQMFVESLYPHGYPGYLLGGLCCPALESFSLRNIYSTLVPFNEVIPLPEKFIPRDVADFLALTDGLKRLTFSRIPLRASELVGILEVTERLLCLAVEEQPIHFPQKEPLLIPEFCRWLENSNHLPELKVLKLGIFHQVGEIMQDGKVVEATLIPQKGAVRFDFDLLETVG
ncbi:hypothetical protein PQX77_020864 [Marasmius sp. AFHP31]|nr:hypothetical protein PQX77_020864 [Marasmius sp. AFHP31]